MAPGFFHAPGHSRSARTFGHGLRALQQLVSPRVTLGLRTRRCSETRSRPVTSRPYSVHAAGTSFSPARDDRVGLSSSRVDSCRRGRRPRSPLTVPSAPNIRPSIQNLTPFIRRHCLCLRTPARPGQLRRGLPPEPSTSSRPLSADRFPRSTLERPTAAYRTMAPAISWRCSTALHETCPTPGGALLQEEVEAQEAGRP